MTQQAQYRHIGSVIPMLGDILNKHSIQIPMLDDILHKHSIKIPMLDDILNKHSIKYQC